MMLDVNRDTDIIEDNYVAGYRMGVNYAGVYNQSLDFFRLSANKYKLMESLMV